MSEFEKRLQKAIERGQVAGDARARAEAERAVSEQEIRRLHTQYRLELSEHIENCVRSISQQLPGFRFETVVSDRGWGAAVSRDDFVAQGARRRGNSFSRLGAAPAACNSPRVNGSNGTSATRPASQSSDSLRPAQNFFRQSKSRIHSF